MRYLQTRGRFLNSAKQIDEVKFDRVDEAMENDITWGGSLIGRLINSTIRVVNIRYKATKVESLLTELRKMLEALLVDVSSISEKDNFREIRARLLLMQIYRVVTDNTLSVEQKIAILLSLADQNRRRAQRTGGTGPLTTASFAYSGEYSLLTEAEQQEQAGPGTQAQGEKKKPDTEEDGLIDITIRDVKSVDIQNKDELVKKLEEFKAKLMEIKYEEEKKEVGDDKRKETKKKYDLYSSTKRFLEGHMDVLRQIKSNSVKQMPSLKKGDVCMWTQKKTNKMLFATVVQDYDGGDRVQVESKDPDSGKRSTFTVAINDIKALTYFDDEKYKAMRETNDQEINKKIFQAKVGYYTYMNKEDRKMMAFYNEELKRLREKLSTERTSGNTSFAPDGGGPGGSSPGSGSAGPGRQVGDKGESSGLPGKDKPNSIGSAESGPKSIGPAEPGPKKESFSLVLEADVLLKDPKQIAAWGYIVNSYQEFIKDKAAYERHEALISGLLKGEYKGTDRKAVYKATSELGREIMRLFNEKYKPVPIGEMTGFTKRTSTQVVKASHQQDMVGWLRINEADDAGQVDAEITQCAESVCRFARVILSLEQDMALAKSFTSSADSEEGVSKSILKMIKSYDLMKESVKPNEKAGLMGFLDFLKVNEASDDETDMDQFSYDEDRPDDEEGQEEPQQETDQAGGDDEIKQDLVVEAWFSVFRRGEEEEWYVEEGEVKKTIGPENGPIVIKFEGTPTAEDPKLDPIIRITNIFGKAYRLYATDYIPSGRPEGRVSQRTMREYEYIGTGDEGRAGPAGTDYYTPGRGPWAAKRVYDKWQDGVMEILEDKWYRRVLANVRFVSAAEQTTGMKQIEQSPERSSGITLLRFITDLLNLEGTFRKARRTLMLKYFNADIGGEKKNLDLDTTITRPPNKDEMLPGDQPLFIAYDEIHEAKLGGNTVRRDNLVKGNIKAGMFYSVYFEDKTQPRQNPRRHWVLWCFHKDDQMALFRMQLSDNGDRRSESMLTKRFQATTPRLKTDGIRASDTTKRVNGLALEENKAFHILCIKSGQYQSFENGREISVQVHRYSPGAAVGTIAPNSIQNVKAKIIRIGVLVKSNPDTSYDVVSLAWEDRAKAGQDAPMRVDQIKTSFNNVNLT